MNIKLLENEVFKDIVGYDIFIGKYYISNMGRVYSPQKVWSVPNNKAKHIRQETIIKGGISKCGYHSVLLSNGKNKKTVKVHRLVALAFIPNENLEKNCVNHKNGNKMDNRVSNLEWVTHTENLCHLSISLNKTSKYVGVSFNKLKKKYRAYITIKGKCHYLGNTFITQEEAHIARCKFILEMGLYIKYNDSICRNIKDISKYTLT